MTKWFYLLIAGFFITQMGVAFLTAPHPVSQGAALAFALFGAVVFLVGLVQGLRRL